MNEVESDLPLTKLKVTQISMVKTDFNSLYR